MAENETNVTLAKVSLGDTTKKAVDKINSAIEQVNANADDIDNLTTAVANAGKVDSVTLNGQSIVNDSKVANIMIKGSSSIDVAVASRDENGNLGVMTISAPTLAKTIKLSMSNDNKYIMTAELLNAEGSQVSKAVIDLPLEEMVISGSYDNENKKIVLSLKNGEVTEIPVADLVDGLVGADNDFADGKVLVADGDGKKAKSSAYRITNIGPGEDGYEDEGEIGVINTVIPTRHVTERMAKASLPYPVTLTIFKCGKDLYDSSHEDYNKLILSATPSTVIIGNDGGSGLAKIAANMCDKYYIPTYLHNASTGATVLTEIEYTHKQNTGESEYTTTIKIAIDSSLQESFVKSWSNPTNWAVYLVKSQSAFFPFYL